jgi:peptide/nickel transport system permease protein
VVPGDAAGVVSGQDATPAEREAVRVALGLDRPALERYVDWIAHALHGDLGTSLVSGREIGDIVSARYGSTMAVLIPATIGISVLAGVLGTAAGLRQGHRLDRFLTGATVVLVGTPDFLLATMLLVVVAVGLPAIPAVALVPPGSSLWQHPELIALPALALALGGFGSTMRLLRASVAQAAQSPFAEFARLNGVRGLRYVRTVVASAAGPAIHTLAVMTAGLLGGGIVVETLFNVPGLGYELSRAVAMRDVPLVQALSLVVGASSLAILLVGDITSRIVGQRVPGQRDRHGASAV